MTTASMPVGRTTLAIGLTCAAAGVAALVLRVADPQADHAAWLLASLAIGGLVSWPLIALAAWRRERALERRTAGLPESISVEPGPDGPVAFVRTRGGDVTTFPLPPGYDPRADGGRWILEHVLPPGTEIGGTAE